MNTNDRRSFLRSLAGLLGVVVPGRAQPVVSRRPPGDLGQRDLTALRIRERAALFQCIQPTPLPISNGDEILLPAYIGNFTQGLPHIQNGEVLPGAYEGLLDALATGSVSALETIHRGSGAKFVDPLAASAFQMEGADSHRL